MESADKIIPDFFTIERIANLHDRSEFDCGVPSLSDWIKRFASQNEARDLSRTYVAVRPENTRVLGYYSLTNAQVSYDIVPPDAARRLPPRMAMPAALIGRLAVDRVAQGKRLGEFLLLNALARVRHLADEVGIHAVVVDAIDDRAKSFYSRYGFASFLDDPRHLFIPLKVVRQLNLVKPD